MCVMKSSAYILLLDYRGRSEFHTWHAWVGGRRCGVDWQNTCSRCVGGGDDRVNNNDNNETLWENNASVVAKNITSKI